MRIIEKSLKSFKISTLDGYKMSLDDFYISPDNLKISFLVISLSSGLYLNEYFLVPAESIIKTDITNHLIYLKITKPDVLTCLSINNENVLHHKDLISHWAKSPNEISCFPNYINANHFIRMRDFHKRLSHSEKYLSIKSIKHWSLYFADGVIRHINKVLIDCEKWCLSDIILRNNFYVFFKEYMLDQKHILRFNFRNKYLYLDLFGTDLSTLPSFKINAGHFKFKYPIKINYKGELLNPDMNLIIHAHNALFESRNKNTKDDQNHEQDTFLH